MCYSACSSRYEPRGGSRSSWYFSPIANSCHAVPLIGLALAAGVPPKVISPRLGHATIAITMDTYSHVIPGLDEQAAETVARLILGDGEVIADLSANKPLATGPDTD